MSTDPAHIVAAVSAQAGRPDVTVAPALLRHSPEPRPVATPVRHDEALAAVHQTWGRVHAHPSVNGAATVGTGLDGEGGAASMRARLRARALTVVADAAGSAQRQDRELIGELIRGMDAVAARVDELSGRLHDLEDIVHDVVLALSEDLTRVMAALAAEPTSDGSTRPPGGATSAR